MTVRSAANWVGGAILDPLKAYSFRLVLVPSLSQLKAHPFLSVVATVLSGTVGGFTSIEGMGWKTEVRTVREGGVNDHVHKLPGRTTCNELVFTKGMAVLDPLWEWYSLTLSGQVVRMNGFVYLMSDLHTPTTGMTYMPTTGIPLAMWHFTGAWPTELEGVRCDASQSLLAVQKMTLAIDSIKKTASIGSFI